MAKVKGVSRPDANSPDGYFRIGYRVNCPGCKSEHVINVYEPRTNGAQWWFNENMDFPTFTPSINITEGLYAGSQLVDENDLNKYPAGKEWNDFLKRTSRVCHFIITDGQIFFAGDTTHELSGQTVDLPDI